MMLRLNCPCCGTIHPIMVNDALIVRGHGDYICPNTGRKVLITFRIEATEEQTFTKEEIARALNEELLRDEQWNAEELDNQAGNN